MARYRASDIRHGPFRWLIRLSGWFCLGTWLFGLITGSEISTIYFGSSGSGLMIGLVCIGLDILVSLTDPDKKNSDSAAANAVIRSNPQLKQVEKTYQEVCKALPTEDLGALLSGLVRQYPNGELVRRTKSDEGFCQALFLRHTTRQMLEFIHSHNPLASYKICLDLLKAAQRSGAGSAGASSSAGGSDNFSNSFDKFSKK